jgi:transposase
MAKSKVCTGKTAKKSPKKGTKATPVSDVPVATPESETLAEHESQLADEAIGSETSIDQEAQLTDESTIDSELADLLGSDFNDEDDEQDSDSLLDQETIEVVEALKEEFFDKGINDFPSIYNCAAGLDVHRKQITVTVVKVVNGALVEETREFGTLKTHVRKLAAWLKESQVEISVMESTGIYWREPYYMLVDAGVKVFLINARIVKSIFGKKTDKNDSQRLAKLARANLIGGKSRVIPRIVEEIRELARTRQKLVQMVTSLKNRIHKQLIKSGFHVDQVATDIFGKSGRIIINGLLAGNAPEAIILNLESIMGYRLKTPREVAVDAIEGVMSDNVRYLITTTLQLMATLQTQITALEGRLLKELGDLGFMPMIRLLETIPGVSTVSAMILLVELGLDLSDFKSAKELSSWAGMCPGNNESAGKRKSCRTTQGNVYLKRILCEMACAAAKTKCYFKDKYAALKLRRGYKRAIVAIGNHLLKVVYHMISNGELYRDRSVDYELLVAEKNAPRWTKALKKLEAAKEEAAAAKKDGNKHAESQAIA